MSKMQELLDEIDLERDRGDYRRAIDKIVEALKLLSRGQQQVMGDLAQRTRTDIPIEKEL